MIPLPIMGRKLVSARPVSSTITFGLPGTRAARIRWPTSAVCVWRAGGRALLRVGSTWRLPAALLPWSGLPYNGLPYRGLPYRGLPYNGLPYNGLPYNGLPYNGLPYNGLPYNGLPYNGLP